MATRHLIERLSRRIDELEALLCCSKKPVFIFGETPQLARDAAARHRAEHPEDREIHIVSWLDPAENSDPLAAQLGGIDFAVNLNHGNVLPPVSADAQEASEPLTFVI